MHARKLGFQSTKPKIVRLPTGTAKTDAVETEELLEQQDPPQPSTLLDQKERVDANVVDFTTLKGYSNRSMWMISNNVKSWHEVHIRTI